MFNDLQESDGPIMLRRLMGYLVLGLSMVLGGLACDSDPGGASSEHGFMADMNRRLDDIGTSDSTDQSTNPLVGEVLWSARCRPRCSGRGRWI